MYSKPFTGIAKMTQKSAARPLPDLYFQTTQFTCGSAIVMTALRALDPAYVPNEEEELGIWREATLVFMGDPPAGCGHYGLALSAMKRGADAEIFEERAEDIFIPRTASAEEERAQRRIMAMDKKNALKEGCRIHPFTLTQEFIRSQLRRERQLIALTSQVYDGHWILFHEMRDNGEALILDPYRATKKEIAENDLLTEQGRRTFSGEQFEQVFRYGPNKGAILLSLGNK